MTDSRFRPLIRPVAWLLLQVFMAWNLTWADAGDRFQESRPSLRQGNLVEGTGLEELEQELQAGLEELPKEKLHRIRVAFQDLIGRDLPHQIRWPKEMPEAQRGDLVEGALQTMTAVAIQENAPFDNPEELEKYLLSRFGVRTIVMGGGRSRGYNPDDPFDSKLLFKADGVNPVLKQALEAARINAPEIQSRVQDVVMLSYNMMYHILRNRQIPPAERKALVDGIPAVLERFTEEMRQQVAVEIPAVTEVVVQTLRDGLRYTASGYRGDLRWTLNELDLRLRDVEKDNTIREGIVDYLGHHLTQELLKAEDPLDPAKQAQVIGDNVLVFLTSIRGPGATYYEALQELERKGILDQTPFTLAVYGDQATAVLDQFPSTYLIGYLTALNQLSWQYQGQPRFPEGQLIHDPALKEFPVVTWGVKSPLDKVEGRGQAVMAQTPFGKIPAENIEWKEKSFQEGKATVALPTGETIQVTPKTQQDLFDQSKRDKALSTQPGGAPYHPSHFLNGNVFIFDNRWAYQTFHDEIMTHLEVYPQGYIHHRKGSNLVELWYTDLIKLGYQASLAQWQAGPQAAAQIPRTKFSIWERSLPRAWETESPRKSFKRITGKCSVGLSKPRRFGWIPKPKLPSFHRTETWTSRGTFPISSKAKGSNSMER